MNNFDYDTMHLYFDLPSQSKTTTQPTHWAIQQAKELDPQGTNLLLHHFAARLAEAEGAPRYTGTREGREWASTVSGRGHTYNPAYTYKLTCPPGDEIPRRCHPSLGISQEVIRRAGGTLGDADGQVWFFKPEDAVSVQAVEWLPNGWLVLEIPPSTVKEYTEFYRDRFTALCQQIQPTEAAQEPAPVVVEEKVEHHSFGFGFFCEATEQMSPSVAPSGGYGGDDDDDFTGTIAAMVRILESPKHRPSDEELANPTQEYTRKWLEAWEHGTNCQPTDCQMRTMDGYLSNLDIWGDPDFECGGGIKMSDYKGMEYVVYNDHMGRMPMTYDPKGGVVKVTSIVEDVVASISIEPNTTDTYSFLLIERNLFDTFAQGFWGWCANQTRWRTNQTTTIGDLWNWYLVSEGHFAHGTRLEVTLEVKDGVVVASNVETLP